jgi:hypothetical protein
MKDKTPLRKWEYANMPLLLGFAHEIMGQSPTLFVDVVTEMPAEEVAGVQGGKSLESRFPRRIAEPLDVRDGIVVSHYTSFALQIEDLVQHVVLVLDVLSQSRAVTGGGIEPKAGLGLAPQVSRPIGGSHDLNVGGPGS